MRVLVILLWLGLVACKPAKNIQRDSPNQLREATFTGTLTPGYHGLGFEEDHPLNPKDPLYIATPGTPAWLTPGYDWERFEVKEPMADLYKFLDETRESRIALPRPSDAGKARVVASRRFRLRGILVERHAIVPGTEIRKGEGLGYQGRYRRMLLLLEARELK